MEGRRGAVSLLSVCVCVDVCLCVLATHMHVYESVSLCMEVYVSC